MEAMGDYLSGPGITTLRTVTACAHTRQLAAASIDELDTGIAAPRIDSADLTDIRPTGYRADLVVLLLHGVPVQGIVVEAQLSPNERRRFVWPVYVTNLPARLGCPMCLLVVTADESVARCAARPVDLGAGNRFAPLVLRPSGVPEILDETQAQAGPELHEGPWAPQSQQAFPCSAAPVCEAQAACASGACRVGPCPVESAQTHGRQAGRCPPERRGSLSA
jgi:hypothetical protein